MKMELEIRALSPALIEDYLGFFDGAAFSDHPEWSFCYCTYYHLGKQDEEALEAQCAGRWTRDILRNTAIDLIKTGRLNGYLAYSDGRVLGWCNAGDKKSFKKLCENRGVWDTGDETPVKSIVCFIVAPGARRMGVASALLARASRDASREGYRVLEAYPAVGALDCYQHYHGHPEMYEKQGFIKHRAFETYCVYRKALSPNGAEDASGQP